MTMQPFELEGVVVDDTERFDRLCAGMVESMTEFDWAPGQRWSLPDELRDGLRDWCRALDAWDKTR